MPDREPSDRDVELLRRGTTGWSSSTSPEVAPPTDETDAAAVPVTPPEAPARLQTEAAAALESVPLTPMLARLARELPREGHVFEPKWDGFRCLAFRHGDELDLRSRNGRPLTRYFPELIGALARVAPDRWVLDGEILVLVDGRFDFAALMSRLHPAASRVRELAVRTPAIFVAFDLPMLASEDLRHAPFLVRRERLLEVLGDVGPPLFVTPATEDRALAQRWLTGFRGGGLDGVVAKHRELRYEPGVRAMVKVKHERTAECVVAGLRVTSAPLQVTSLMLGLYDASGALEHIGVVSSLSKADGSPSRASSSRSSPRSSGIRGRAGSWQGAVPWVA